MDKEIILTEIQIKEVVKDIIRKKTHLKEVNGFFECDIYVDYRDGMSKSQINNISKAKNKMETFWDELEEFATESIWYAEDDLFSVIKGCWNEEEHGYYDEYEDFIRDWVRQELVSFNFPYDHFLKTDVCVNILVDSGDGNYDYTLNNFMSYNASEDEEIDDESSILWLVKQQGYTKDDLYKAMNEGEYQDSKFLKTVVEELTNVTSHMNALAFFVKMTLKEFIEFSDNNQSIHLSKNTRCGLYDLWSGGGSLLEIELEKDVIIPKEFLEYHVDGARGYSIDEIYGVFSSHWTETVIEFIS